MNRMRDKEEGGGERGTEPQRQEEARLGRSVSERVNERRRVLGKTLI